MTRAGAVGRGRDCVLFKSVFFLGVCDQLPVSDKKEDEEGKKKNALVASTSAGCLRHVPTKATAATIRTNRKNISLVLL